MRRIGLALPCVALTALAVPLVLRLANSGSGPLPIGLALQAIALGLVAALLPSGALGALPHPRTPLHPTSPQPTSQRAGDAVRRTRVVRRAGLASMFGSGTAVLMPEPAPFTACLAVIAIVVAVAAARLHSARPADRARS